MSHIPDGFFERYDVNPSQKAAFKFFYGQTAKEGLPVAPEFAWAEFENGIASFNGQSLKLVDDVASMLVANYTEELAKENNTYPFAPIDQSITEGFIKNLEKARLEKSARVIGIHPTLASPLVYARTIGMGYEKYLDTDIRENIYITYGAYPTTMMYDYGEGYRISPTELGRTLGNIVLTAPRSDNTITDDEMVVEWMSATRSTFKMRNHDLLSEPGNIVIVIPSGRRGERSKSKVFPNIHKEFLPDGSINYITEYDNETFVMGVGDSLLIERDSPSSIVHIGADHISYRIRNRKQLRDALVKSATLASSGDDIYEVEGSNDQRIRQGRKTAEKFFSRHNSDKNEEVNDY